MLFLDTLLPERDACCRYIDTGIVFCRTLLLEILELDRERLVISLASTDALQANMRYMLHLQGKQDGSSDKKG
jgi:hypothetical protein